ncbi:MAG: signal peptide peptidase SppA [Rhodothermales bacterium]
MRFFSTLIASTLGSLIALGVIVMFFFLLVFALAASTDQSPRVRPGSVLVIELGGSIPEVVSEDPIAVALSGEHAYDLLDFKSAVKKAGVDERIDAIWLKLSPMSASWATLEEVRTSLNEFKKAGKPIIASSDDQYVNEVTYYVGSVADELYASAAAPFEFNGFYIVAEFYKNLLDKLEIAPQVTRAGTYKSAVEPFLRTNLSDENREQLTQLLTDQQDVFVAAVAESRSMEPEEVVRLIEGESILTATDAYNAGLLDDLLFRDEVETVIKNRLSYDADDDLRLIGLHAYARVPATEAGLPRPSTEEIAIVYAVGTIMTGESGYSANPLFGGETVGSDTFVEAMRAAHESDNVKAIVVRVNSPGGSVAASDAMWREISRAAAIKPVVISMGDLAASGGFWIATAGHHIVADPLTITGSIGVFGMAFDMGGLYEDKLGISFDVVRTGPYADMYSGVRSLSPDEMRLLDKSTEETYQNFLELVAASRNMTVEEVDKVAQGRVWTGKQALAVGLVDELGGLEVAIQRAAERAGIEGDTYRTRVLPLPKTMLEQMTESLNGRIASAWLNRNTTAAERALMQHLDVIHTLMQFQGTVQARLPFRLVVQ